MIAKKQPQLRMKIGNGSSRILGSDGKPYTNREWEAAEDTRLNSGHWSKVQGTNVNQRLNTHGDTLRQRTVYEIINNPIISGMVQTHVTDIVGDSGPELRVMTSEDDSDNGYAQLLE